MNGLKKSKMETKPQKGLRERLVSFFRCTDGEIEAQRGLDYAKDMEAVRGRAGIGRF